MHIFSDMGYLVERFMAGLEDADLVSLGRLMNIHQLLQEKMGTSCPESDVLVEAAIAGGALGAKISGSGCGGIVIALCQPGHEEQVAASMEAAGGMS
jgi:galactokinase